MEVTAFTKTGDNNSSDIDPPSTGLDSFTFTNKDKTRSLPFVSPTLEYDHDHRREDTSVPWHECVDKTTHKWG